MALLAKQLLYVCCTQRSKMLPVLGVAVRHCHPYKIPVDILHDARKRTNNVAANSDGTDAKLSNVYSTLIRAMPEFSAFPRNHRYSDPLVLRLMHKDMMARRAVIDLPEFHVGSVLSVTYAEELSPEKKGRFVGICIDRKNHGISSRFILRNVIDGMGCEVNFNLYNPRIQKIEVLLLEKRLDPQLYYLRDAPPEYSTIPFDMKQKHLPRSAPVPLNDNVVPLLKPPWCRKWHRYTNYKGFKLPDDYEIDKVELRKWTRSRDNVRSNDLFLMYLGSTSDESKTEVVKNLLK